MKRERERERERREVFELTKVVTASLLDPTVEFNPVIGYGLFANEVCGIVDAIMDRREELDLARYKREIEDRANEFKQAMQATGRIAFAPGYGPGAAANDPNLIRRGSDRGQAPQPLPDDLDAVKHFADGRIVVRGVDEAGDAKKGGKDE